MDKKTKIIILTIIAILFCISFSNFNVEKVYAAEMIEPIGNVQSALSYQDDTYTEVSLKSVFGSGIKFGEKIYESIFIGTNGYITFGHGNSGYSPLGIKGYTRGPIVAAQYDDIDLRKGGNIYYYQNAGEGYVVATFKDVAPFNRPTGTEVEYPENKFDYNSYQIILRRIPGYNLTDFQIEIRYNKLGWARAAINSEWPTAGWSAGDQETYIELPQSGQSNFTDILNESNIGTSEEYSGIYRWDVINGIVQSQPTVNETYVSSITTNSASSGGNVSNDGGLNITERGIVYSTNLYPTINDNKVICNGETGSFTAAMTGLSSGTTYYVRAYATNNLGTGYGPERSFTTKSPTPPTVTTSSVSLITHSSAVSGGNVLSNGYRTITERGIVYSTNHGPTIDDNKIIIDGEIGIFTASMTGLYQETTYYVRAYAINALGTSYGAEEEFTTKKLTCPSVDTTSVSSVNYNSAVVEGNVISDGGADITERGIVYSTDDNPDINDNKVIITGETGSFTANLNNLAHNTEYNVRAYATNSQGTSYGNKLSFDTLATVPQITDANISGSSIELTVNSDANPINTLYYVEASTLANDFSSPTVVANWTTLNNGKIIFDQSNLLNRDTCYYFRIRAKNNEGILTDYDVNDPVSIPSTMYVLTLPETPGELNVVPVSASEMTISGYNVPKVDSEEITYNIYRDNEIIAEDITDLTYTDSGNHLKPNMNYTYKVEAVNASGASNQSTNTKYTLADKVGQVILKSKNNNSITLNLDKGNNEEEPEYKVIAKEVENELNIIEGVWSSTTVYTLSGLSKDTSYYLYISTRNLDGAESDNTKEIRVLAELGNIRPSNFTCDDITIYSNNSKNNQYAKVGDIVTVRFTLDEYFDLNNDIITASIGGKEANVSFIGSLAIANYEYEAAYTMTNTDKEGELDFCINLINENSIELQINTVTDTSKVIFDKTVPELTLVGNSEINIDKDETYVEQGYEVLDNVSGINGSVNITGDVDTSIIGDYTLIYSIEDNAGNLAQTSRTIHVVQPMTLSIEDASNIRLTSATLNAEIFNLGAANDLLSYGFVWNETGSPTINDNKVELTGLIAPGAFTYTIISLSENEKYYFAAYAKDSTGIRYSETKTLHTNKRHIIPKLEETGDSSTSSGITTGETTTESAIEAEDNTTRSAVQLENITEEEKEALTRKTPEEDKKDTEIVGPIVRFIQEADVDENEYNERVLTIPTTPTSNSSINTDNLVAVLMDEETGEYIPVPAKITVNEDGITTVVIKHKGSGVYTVIENNREYSKITDNHWARETVATMSRKLMLDDVFDNGMDLELGITRGQMAGLMVKILGINTNEFESDEEFTDLKQDNKWYKYMSTAVELDIFEGYGDNIVKPEQIITREEMAAVMFRAIEKIKTLSEEQGAKVYQDQDNIKSWAAGKVNTLSLLEVFEGYNDGHFKPENNIKIGEALTALYRMGRYLDFVD